MLLLREVPSLRLLRRHHIQSPPTCRSLLKVCEASRPRPLAASQARRPYCCACCMCAWIHGDEPPAGSLVCCLSCLRTRSHPLSLARSRFLLFLPTLIGRN